MTQNEKKGKDTFEAVVFATGQIFIPAPFRRKNGLESGTKLKLKLVSTITETKEEKKPMMMIDSDEEE